jgi:hypothetical protein
MRRVINSLTALLLLLPLLPLPAPAQAARAAIGGATGVAGGAAVTLATVVARARFQREYLESVDDLIHWQSAPMIAAPTAGVLFGLAGEDALKGSIVGSSTGLVIGGAVGAGLGWVFSKDPEGPWAGGVIGAGVGLAAGGLLGGLRAWSEDEDADLAFPNELRFAFTIPVP